MSEKRKPEVELGSNPAPEATTKLDPERNIYEPPMFKKGEERPAKGTIHITVFPHKEYDVKFEGDLIGSDINRAWRMMIRAYRLWKASQAKSHKPLSQSRDMGKDQKQEVNK